MQGSMTATDPEQRRVNRPFDKGPLIRDLAAAPRNALRLNVTKDTANLALLPHFAAIRVLAAREVPPAIMEAALGAMRGLSELDIFGTRMTSLAPLAGLPLARLRLVWAHQLTDITPLARLDRLETLTIGDMKRAHDFAPLARCGALKALHIESGMWANQKVASLAFLKDMSGLENLSFNYLTVPGDDLTPICALKGLRFLHLPSKYRLREYARLAVCLPDTQCEQFASHTTYRVGSGFDPDSPDGFAVEEHVVLVGKPATSYARKDPKCAPAIARREALLERWRAHYRSVPDPVADTRETLD
jgi:hypothetical protein